MSSPHIVQRLLPSFLMQPKGRIIMWLKSSLASHTLHRERKGLVTLQPIGLLPWQKLDVTNQICALCRSHPLSWSTITSCVQEMSASYYLTAMVDNCIPWQQFGSCSVTRPFLSLQRVWLARLAKQLAMSMKMRLHNSDTLPSS